MVPAPVVAYKLDRLLSRRRRRLRHVRTSDHRTVDALGVPVTAGETDTGGKGWFGTVQVGCDYQFADRWVIGAFADYDFSSLKGNFQPTGLSARAASASTAKRS